MRRRTDRSSPQPPLLDSGTFQAVRRSLALVVRARPVHLRRAGIAGNERLADPWESIENDNGLGPPGLTLVASMRRTYALTSWVIGMIRSGEKAVIGAGGIVRRCSPSYLEGAVPEDQPGSGIKFEGQEVSVNTVDALIERVQRLIDSRSTSEDPLAWSIKASYLGDLPAIAALATIAARCAERQILIIRELDAPAGLVYEAWTTPELVKQWWGGGRGTVKSAEIDLRVGGEWRYVLVDTDGRQSAFCAEYREIVPNERIVSAERNELVQGESVTTVVFTEVLGRTRLTLLVQLASSQARDAALSSGMNRVLEEQMKLLEQVSTSLADHSPG